MRQNIYFLLMGLLLGAVGTAFLLKATNPETVAMAPAQVQPRPSALVKVQGVATPVPEVTLAKKSNPSVADAGKAPTPSVPAKPEDKPVTPPAPTAAAAPAAPTAPAFPEDSSAPDKQAKKTDLNPSLVALPFNKISSCLVKIATTRTISFMPRRIATQGVVMVGRTQSKTSGNASAGSSGGAGSDDTDGPGEGDTADFSQTLRTAAYQRAQFLLHAAQQASVAVFSYIKPYQMPQQAMAESVHSVRRHINRLGAVARDSLHSALLHPSVHKHTLLPLAKKRKAAFFDSLPFSTSTTRFSLHKLGAGSGPTLLVVGGIQGDEPGGFSAASLLATHYSITSGNVWVIPDLNVQSILTRSRGEFGDMNRKFDNLPESDPEYELVEQVKAVLLDKHVDLILNLHDGSGFYRPTWENAKCNPTRWGQSVIIDQTEVDAPQFNHLEAMALQAGKDANMALIHPTHRYYIRNTNTRYNDKEMEKSLSYFAVRHGKPAFGVEASKEFSTEYRSYYHMTIIESFMRQMGIQYNRNFVLRPEGVLVALNSNLKLSVFDNKVVLPLDNVRPELANIPFKVCGSLPSNKASRPLLALVEEGNLWRVAYGNRTLTRIKPLLIEFEDSLNTVSMIIDGKERSVKVGEMVSVKSSFKVASLPGYRVNAIGALKEKNGTEADISLVKADFNSSFSVDRKGTLYRVEIYRGKAFSGMILVSFGYMDKYDAAGESLTATNGQESDFGY